MLGEGGIGFSQVGVPDKLMWRLGCNRRSRPTRHLEKSAGGTYEHNLETHPNSPVFQADSSPVAEMLGANHFTCVFFSWV